VIVKSTEMKNYYSIALLVIFFSCSEDVLQQTELTANAGPDQTVAPFTQVTLDGSASVGENLTYDWTYNGGPMSSAELVLSNSTSSDPSFVPTKNGVYNFTLEVTSGIRFSEDQVQITVSGALVIGGTLTQDLTLKDFEPNPEMPDYIISSDLIVPDGITLKVEDGSGGNVHVKADNGKGIIIKAGGAMRINSGSTNRFTSDTGWKGILVDGGIIDFSNVITTLDKAGSSVFEGQSLAAAVTLAGLEPKISNFTNVQFTNSPSHDILVASSVSTSVQDGVINSNVFSNSVPIKAPISFLPKIGFNSYPTSFSYIHLVPSGAGAVDVTSTFTFPGGGKYFIDGDFTAGSPIVMSNVIVYMKQGAGILSQKDLTLTAATVKGLDGATWKGIAFASSSNQMAINSSSIEDAGSDVFATGFFSTAVKAALYFSSGGNSTFSNSSIVDSGGYGIFSDDQFAQINIQQSTFTGTTLAAIRTRLELIHNSVGTGNSFTMPTGVAAVEVQVPNLTTSPLGTWNSLGVSNFYLISNNLRQSGGSWTLAPGVNLKFKSGKFLELEQGGFTAIGTSESPITFESETGTAGSWAGIHVQTTTKFEYCRIKNGGEVLILKNGVTPATEKANIVFNYGGIISTNTFKNNVISGSGGYGILVEAGKQNPDALNVVNNNGFSVNTSGDVIVK